MATACETKTSATKQPKLPVNLLGFHKETTPPTRLKHKTAATKHFLFEYFPTRGSNDHHPPPPPCFWAMEGNVCIRYRNN